MAGRVALSGVTDSLLSLTDHVDAVADPAAGATVSFSGAVRNHDHGRGVAELEYQSHPTAAAIVASVAAQIAAREGIIAVAVTHRVGRLNIGDIAIVAAVSSAHRRAAFDACADLVDEVKKQLPVWKRQIFSDGSDEWVGSA
ncbi:molybdenum cofactor biosynthesis protein MoaE [Nakamurella antarctica]|uniref:Molybdenum cofactor biosynthesis protein MoaE n=1 Tax=Nakamurella antarctica TaxID=1902245 RepID=A0A3G8ZK77_9ACTN|nr:molybdenum cofactor biosynthesis protein MoaE [Nakamurella antarctica]AZI57255.1 molybdenum cofactor biosynthesis protein MoaE [Nakamurella antarctica]